MGTYLFFEILFAVYKYSRMMVKGNKLKVKLEEFGLIFVPIGSVFTNYLNKL